MAAILDFLFCYHGKKPKTPAFVWMVAVFGEKSSPILKNTWLRVDGTQVEFIRYKNAFHFSVSGKGVKNWFWLFCFGEFFVVVISMLIHELIVRSRSARTVFPPLITECSHRS